MIMAVASSHLDKPIDPHTMVIGEVGLAGEVRAITQPEQRIVEAEKLGFKTCILPAGNLKRLKKGRIKLEGVATVEAAMQLLDTVSTTYFTNALSSFNKILFSFSVADSRSESTAFATESAESKC